MLLLFCCCLIFEIAFWFVSVKCSCRPNFHILLACVCVLCMSAHVIRMLCEHASKQSDAWFRPGTLRIMTRWTNSQPASQHSPIHDWITGYAYGCCSSLRALPASAVHFGHMSDAVDVVIAINLAFNFTIEHVSESISIIPHLAPEFLFCSYVRPTSMSFHAFNWRWQMQQSTA